jgi:predicted dehydrogenase
MAKTRLAIVGLGKIARDQHIPSLARSDAFELVAIASLHGKLEGMPSYSDLETLLKAIPDVEAVALCTPPQVRYETARLALKRGLHVLLEKPPGVTVSEVHALAALANKQGVALLASWHSRHAPGVEPARAWLEGRTLSSVTVTWKEDVRVWHPGQTWIWKAGGLGVFDPGINALSILTRMLPGALRLQSAELRYPRNCETPIAATLKLEGTDGAQIGMELDFLHSGPPSWDIEVQTEAGRLTLSRGGSEMRLNGALQAGLTGQEYPDLYAHFARLVRSRSVDADVRPLQLVSDAYLCGRRIEVEPFVE